MGNCSLRAVADATQEPNKQGMVRVRSTSTFNTCTMIKAVPKGKRTVEVMPSPQGNGTWKVKLVINPRDLEKILSEEVNTEALIQQMRTATANSTPIRGKSSCSKLTHNYVC